MMEITPTFKDKKNEPLYVQLYKYLKEEIQTGRIEPGAKLPSKRKLAVHLAISQNTIENAYQQLMAEGYVKAEPRKGLYVIELDGDINPKTAALTFPDNNKTIGSNSDYKIDFSHGMVDLEQFPFTIWRKLTAQALYNDESEIFLNGDPQGEPSLREEIANYLFQSRGVRCSPEQIIIGAGSQYLVSFLMMLIGKNHIYAMEDPGFHRTRAVFQDQGAITKSIPLDDEGICLENLEKSQANVVYITPSHQFPTGMIMPITRRLELLKWASEGERYIIEDDYDGEFRYKGKPIPSLQSLDTNGKVIYLGTFSKSLIPSIRISYIVLPDRLLDKYKSHFTVYKQTVSRLHQHTLTAFMKNGHWKSHLNKMRVLYRKKQNVVLASIKKYLGEKTEVIGEHSGLHILLQVKNRMSESELIESAKSKKVKIYPTSIYYAHDEQWQPPMVLLGFGGVTEAEIEEGIQLLSEAWF